MHKGFGYAPLGLQHGQHRGEVSIQQSWSFLAASMLHRFPRDVSKKEYGPLGRTSSAGTSINRYAKLRLAIDARRLELPPEVAKTSVLIRSRARDLPEEVDDLIRLLEP